MECSQDSPHAADFFCAAPRMARSLCPTMISSPGLMVLDTNSIWSGFLRSFRFGFGLVFSALTVLDRLGLSGARTSRTRLTVGESCAELELLYGQVFCYDVIVIVVQR